MRHLFPCLLKCPQWWVTSGSSTFHNHYPGIIGSISHKVSGRHVESLTFHPCPIIRSLHSSQQLLTGKHESLPLPESEATLTPTSMTKQCPLWWPQERPDPCELLGGLSGFLCRRCQGLRTCAKSVPEPEDSSPVLTWILGYFWFLAIMSYAAMSISL